MRCEAGIQICLSLGGGPPSPHYLFGYSHCYAFLCVGICPRCPLSWITPWVCPPVLEHCSRDVLFVVASWVPCALASTEGASRKYRHMTEWVQADHTLPAVSLPRSLGSPGPRWVSMAPWQVRWAFPVSASRSVFILWDGCFGPSQDPFTWPWLLLGHAGLSFLRP